MTIDELTGALRWVPRIDQVGFNEVTIRALDVQGGTDEQTFEIFVRAVNTPPQITSVPPTTGRVGQLYTYAVRATDGVLSASVHEPIPLIGYRCCPLFFGGQQWTAENGAKFPRGWHERRHVSRLGVARMGPTLVFQSPSGPRR